MSAERLRVVLVTGLSGGGKASVLRALEDVGYEAVDNPPLPMLEDMVKRSARKLAIGVDARTRGFDATLVLETLDRLRANPALRPELVYAWADETTLQRRYSETKRRHPLAPQGRVADGIAQEGQLTAPLYGGADLVIDTSELPLGSLRRLIERQFGADSGRQIWSLMHVFCVILTTTLYYSLGPDWTQRSAPSWRRTRILRHSSTSWPD
jgi:UPF0042 nucleotide-binding protein